MRDEPRPVRASVAWVVGAVAGATVTWVAILLPWIGIVLYASVAFALVRALRAAAAAAAGAMLLATGAWFAYIDHGMTARCEAINRSGGFCEILDRDASAVAPLAFLLVGAVLSIVGLVSRRPA